MNIARVYIEGVICPEDWVKDTYFPHTSLTSVRWMVEGYGDFDEIDVTINSGGGSYNEGMAIFDYLKSFGKPITTKTFGLCGSIATVIFEAGEKDRRFIGANAEFFVHLVDGGVTGNVNEIGAYLAELQRWTDHLINFYVQYTGLDQETVTNLLVNDSTLSAQEAVDKGFASAIIQPMTASKYLFNKPAEALTLTASVPAIQPPPAPAPSPAPATNSIIHTMSDLRERALGFLNSLIDFTANKKPLINMKVTLQDGTTVDIDAAAETPGVGDSVKLENEPLPDGTYTTADGLKITVKNGVISETPTTSDDGTETSQEPTNQADPETPPTDQAAQIVSLQSRINQLEQEKTNQQQEFTAYQNRTTAVLNHVQKMMGQQISAEPEGITVNPPLNQPTNSAPVESPDDLFKDAKGEDWSKKRTAKTGKKK